jgi:hypothetical protein
MINLLIDNYLNVHHIDERPGPSRLVDNNTVDSFQVAGLGQDI